MKLIIMQLPRDPSSYLLGQNNFLNNLFSKNLSLCSSPKVRDQVSHPYSMAKYTVGFWYEALIGLS